MRRIVSLLTVLLLCTVVAFSQQRTISGRVINDKGEPVPYASVKIKGTTQGVAADAEGNYKIQAKSGDVLVITATGITIQEVSVGSSDVLDVAATSSSTAQLTEVVVTAMGVQKQAKELGYSTARIRNTELTQAKVSNIQNGLVGKVSGLNITTANNGVFANTRITLRGIRSLLGNNQPILVVDGTPLPLGYLNSINPNDVDNVSVLKGANASALYGPEGVNGVIMVTTRRGGGSRQRPRISVGYTTLFESVQFMPDFQTRFGSGSATDANGDGIYDPIENQSWGDEFDGTDRPIGQGDEDGNENIVPYKYLPGEKLRFFNTGINQQADVSLGSGDENSAFYISLQNNNVKGIVPGDKTNRTTFRINADRRYGIVKASVNFGYTLGTYDVNNSEGPAYWYVINTPHNIPLTRYKNWRPEDRTPENNWANRNTFYNDYFPNTYENIAMRRNNGRTDDIFGNFTLEVKPTKWLNLLNRFGYNYSNSQYKNTIEAIDYNQWAIDHRSFASGGDEPASVADGLSMSNRYNNELIGTINKEFGKFGVKFLAGNLIRQSYSKSVATSGNNLVIPTLFNNSSRSGEPGASESNFRTRLISAFGELSFSWNNWAFLSFTGRNDWDSRLPEGSNSYFYPGVNAALVLTDMIPGLADNNFLSYAKIRGAWNKTGNVNYIGAYQLENTFSPTGGFPYGSLAGFTASNTLNNNAIKPETVESYEVGAEFAFFRDRVRLEGSYYYQNNDDQIIPVVVSTATGYTNAILNAAQFWNQGFEVDLGLTPFLKLGNVQWNLSANYAYNDSKVISLYGDLNELGVGNTSFVIKGYPAYTHKLVDWQRVKDVDTNSPDDERVVIDPVTGYPTQNSTQGIFGRTNPKHILGLKSDISWKGLSLGVVAEYRGGNYIYNAVGSSLGFTGIDRMSATNGRQRFVFPNSAYNDGSGKYVTNNSIVVSDAHYAFLQAGRFRNTQTNYYSSAAFWKIREIVLGYQVPSSALGNGKIFKGVGVSVIGRNLFTFRPETNWWTDPEFSNTTGNAVGTTDIGQTPPTRYVGFSVNLTF